MAVHNIEAEYLSAAVDGLFCGAVQKTVGELLANASDPASLSEQLREELLTMVRLAELVESDNQKIKLLRAAVSIVESLAPATLQ